MPGYRLYFFDQAEHIRQAAVIESDDDDGAMHAACGKRDGRAMELWRLDRLVRRFPAAPAARPINVKRPD